MHISDRLKSIQASITLEIDARAKAMAEQGMDVIGFGAGEPDFPTPDFVREAGKAAIDKGLTKYTPATGTLDLRRAICDKLRIDNGLSYEPAQIVASNGAKHALHNAFMALLNPGDEVLVPAPAWVSYPELIKLAGGVPVFVEGAASHQFKPTIAQFEAAVTPRTVALLINSPNNPNGYVYDRAELEALAAFAIAHDLAVVSDEIYEYLVYDGAEHVSIASLPGMIERTIVINGLSKSFAMTGWRIGYTASPLPIAKAMGNFQSHATSNPSSITQYASAVALRGSHEQVDAMREAFRARRDRLCALIDAIPGLSCRTPQGAFYVMMGIGGVIGKRCGDAKIEGSLSFCAALLDAQKVAVVPGIAFGADGYCRLSYATSMDNIERGMARIADFVAQLT